MHFKRPLLIVIAGPTAVGKSHLAIKLAKYFNTEIISCDSRQFYKELNIGVAKLNKDEMGGINHHLIGSKSIDIEYTINDFQNDFSIISKKIFQKNKICFLCGGSGLYIESVCKGFNKIPEVSNEIRKKLNNRLKSEGLDQLCLELKEKDPITYKKIDKKNPRRIIRALEVCISTKIPYSYFLNTKIKEKEFDSLYIFINKEREDLYKKIDLRVDRMIEKGLIEEVKSLKKYKNKRALQSIGYTEVFNYLNTEKSINETIQLIKRNSRRYAKRQITWFKKNNYIEIENDFEKVKSLIESKIKTA